MTKRDQFNPYDHIACGDADPEWFDMYEAPTIALNYCKECPMRRWCLEQVNPARMGYDGIAGGHVFKDGRVITRWSNINDPILKLYQRRAGNNAAARHIDEAKIDQLIMGERSYGLCSFEERVHAALRMAARGHTIDEAIERTQLDPDQVADIFSNPSNYMNRK